MRQISLFLLMLSFLFACGKSTDESNKLSQDGISAKDSIETQNANPDVTAEEDPVEEAALFLEDLFNYDSEAKLIETFGADNVSRGIDYLPEGLGQYPVSILYEGSDKAVQFTWKDTTSFERLESVFIEGQQGQWKTQKGLRLGMNTDEIAQLNGKNIRFSGFGWDYAGFVQLDGGKLDDKKTTLRLSLPANFNGGQAYDAIYGDVLLNNETPLVRKAKPILTNIEIYKELL